MQDRNFIKLNSSAYEDALLMESRGLALLDEAIKSANITEVKIPKVQEVSSQRLVLEHIDSSPATLENMRSFGENLARLHKHTSHRHYGLDYDNFIGLNRQSNRPASEWGLFFVEHRLEYQIKIITDTGVREQLAAQLQKVKPQLMAYLNERSDKPSLCHGDLWSGNVLFQKEHSYLIDPAVYYGDRETDIAMTEMFGGFSSAFHDAYDKTYPLSVDYQNKKQIYNLYHYLNHYNLFGDSYLQTCLDIVKSLPEIVHGQIN